MWQMTFKWIDAQSGKKWLQTVFKWIGEDHQFVVNGMSVDFSLSAELIVSQ